MPRVEHAACRREPHLGLPRFLTRIFEAHLAEHPSHTGHLFSAPEGGPLRHRAFMARTYRPAVTAARLPATLRVHDLRHICARLLIAAGAHLEEIEGPPRPRLHPHHLGRHGHLYDAARERLRDHLDATYTQTTSVGAGGT
jgi:hypothetical protein